VSISVRR